MFHCCTYPVLEVGVDDIGDRVRTRIRQSQYRGCRLHGTGGAVPMRTSVPAAELGNRVEACEKPGVAPSTELGRGADGAVVEDSVAAADRGLAVAPRIPREAEARREAVVVVLDTNCDGRLDSEIVGLRGDDSMQSAASGFPAGRSTRMAPDRTPSAAHK
jgi:hypothetical protein